MSRSRFTPLLVLLAFAACGGDSPSPENAASTTDRSGNDVGSIAINPADGTLMAGSGPAFYRLKPGRRRPRRPRAT